MNEKRLKTLSLEKERVLRIPKEIFCQNRYASFLEEKVPLSMKKGFRCSGSLFL
jgi:hypothetical protein